MQKKEIYMLWAESSDGSTLSPSLLLAQTLLMVRKEAAMFLRMSTGFGYAQIGDYTASLFYLFRCYFHCNLALKRRCVLKSASHT